MSLQFCVSVLRLCGAWHDRRRDRTVLRWAGRLHTSLAASLLAAMVVSHAVEVRDSRRDLTRVTGVACILLLVVSSAGKLLLVSSAQGDVSDLEERLAGLDLPHADELDSAAERRSKRLAACYFGLSSVLVVFWSCAPAAGPSGRRALPHVSWCPFDVSQSPYYEIVYATQVVGSVLFSAITVAADTLFFVLTIKVCAMFEIISAALVCDEQKNDDYGKKIENNFEALTVEIHHQQLRRRSLPSESTNKNMTDMYQNILQANYHSNAVDINSSFTYSARMTNDKAYKNLLQCIRLHQRALRYSATLERISYLGSLVQYLISLFIICLSGFQTTLDFADSITRIKFLLYLTTASFEVFLFCWYGSNLIQESSRIREAAFLSSWPEGSGRYRQAVTLVMLAAQRPRHLTVGKFRVLSLETFVAQNQEEAEILKQSSKDLFQLANNERPLQISYLKKTRGQKYSQLSVDTYCNTQQHCDLAQLLNLSYSLFLVLREVYGRNKDGKITT